jgi:hypothetical protein
LALLDEYRLGEVWEIIVAYAELRQRQGEATYVDPYPILQDSAPVPARRRVSQKEAFSCAERRASGRHGGWIPNPGRIQVVS